MPWPCCRCSRPVGIVDSVTLGSQLALTTLGHFRLSPAWQLVKCILDTDIERLEQLGSASLLASHVNDIRNITVAFVRLPELVQGGDFNPGGSGSSGWLCRKCRRSRQSRWR
ncbi:hypothetical protein M8494_00370 [Serratia ureilytica]